MYKDIWRIGRGDGFSCYFSIDSILGIQLYPHGPHCWFLWMKASCVDTEIFHKNWGSNHQFSKENAKSRSYSCILPLFSSLLSTMVATSAFGGCPGISKKWKLNFVTLNIHMPIGQPAKNKRWVWCGRFWSHHLIWKAWEPGSWNHVQYVIAWSNNEHTCRQQDLVHLHSFKVSSYLSGTLLSQNW